MKKTDVDSIEKLDEYYNKTRKMKFDSNEKIESIEDIYYTLYAQKIEENDVTRTAFKYAPTTYYKNGTQQCVASKYRSLDDFIKICKLILWHGFIVKHIQTKNTTALKLIGSD